MFLKHILKGSPRLFKINTDNALSHVEVIYQKAYLETQHSFNQLVPGFTRAAQAAQEFFSFYFFCLCIFFL